MGIPDDAASCHTALVDGYAIEGHVPIQAMERLLVERPEIVGLALPGMPGDETTWTAQSVVAIAVDGSLRAFVY